MTGNLQTCKYIYHGIYIMEYIFKLLLLLRTNTFRYLAAKSKKGIVKLHGTFAVRLYAQYASNCTNRHKHVPFIILPNISLKRFMTHYLIVIFFGGSLHALVLNFGIHQLFFVKINRHYEM